MCREGRGAVLQLGPGGGLLDAETMPAPLRDGAVVWGLELTTWISSVKDLPRALQASFLFWLV